MGSLEITILGARQLSMDFLKSLVLALPCVFSQQGWLLKNLESDCNLGGMSSISFDYYPATIGINEDTFSAGSCSYEQITVDNMATTEIDGKTFRSYIVTYDPTICGSARNIAGDLSSYGSIVNFRFDTGFTVSGMFLNIREHIIPASCTFQSTYDLEYNFGILRKETITGETETGGIQETEGGITFDILAFTDADRQTPLTGESSAGDLSFVTIKPTTSLISGYTYAPITCKIEEDKCTDPQLVDTCTEMNSFTLFDGTGTTCHNIDFLKFNISHLAADDHWHFEFMLFLFNPNEINQYKLKCQVQVCVDSADPTNTCNKVTDTCLGST